MATQVSQEASKKAAKNFDVVEEKVKLAVDAYKSGEYKTIKAAAEAFDAPYYRTRSRCQGRHSRQFNGGNNKVLNDEMETAFHASLQRLIKDGIVIGSHQLWREANDILRLASEDGSSKVKQVRLRWARRYLARNRDTLEKLQKQGASAERRLQEESSQAVSDER